MVTISLVRYWFTQCSRGVHMCAWCYKVLVPSMYWNSIVHWRSPSEALSCLLKHIIAFSSKKYLSLRDFMQNVCELNICGFHMNNLIQHPSVRDLCLLNRIQLFGPNRIQLFGPFPCSGLSLTDHTRHVYSLPLALRSCLCDLGVTSCYLLSSTSFSWMREVAHWHPKSPENGVSRVASRCSQVIASVLVL